MNQLTVSFANGSSPQVFQGEEADCAKFLDNLFRKAYDADVQVNVVIDGPKVSGARLVAYGKFASWTEHLFGDLDASFDYRRLLTPAEKPS